MQSTVSFEEGLYFTLYIIVCIVLFIGIYYLNQRAVQKSLIPRRIELEQMKEEVRDFLAEEA